MIRNKLFAAILSIGVWKSAMPALEHVHVTPTTVRVTDLYLDVAYDVPPGSALLEGSVGVPTKWLLKRLREAGTGEKASPIAVHQRAVTDGVRKNLAGVETTVSFNGKQFTVRGIPGHEMPARPVAGDDVVESELAVVDFAKGGAVDQVLPFVCTDETRPAINCVLLAPDEAVGLDGHALLQRPLTKGPASPLLLARQGALAIRRLIDHTDVERLVLRRDAVRAWFVATCADGAEWTVSVKLVDAPYPPYKEVAERVASAAHVVSATVDPAELRGLVDPLGSCHVAIFEDGGLVAWPFRGEGEIAMSLADYPSEPPITVASSDGLARLLKGTKAERVQVDVCGRWKDCNGEIRIDGRVMASSAVGRGPEGALPGDWSEGIPRWVRERMAVDFGLAEFEPAPDRAEVHERLLAEALADEKKRGHVPALFNGEMRGAIANLGTETAAAALCKAVVVDRRDGTFLAMPGDKVKPYPFPVLHLGLPTKADLRAVRGNGMLYPVDAGGGYGVTPPERQPSSATVATVARATPAPTKAPEPAAAAAPTRKAAERLPRRPRAAAAAPAAVPVETAVATPSVAVTSEMSQPEQAAVHAPTPVEAPVTVAAPVGLSAAKRAWLTRRANGWTPTRRAGTTASAAQRPAAAPLAADGTALSPAQRAWITRRAKLGANAVAPCA